MTLRRKLIIVLIFILFQAGTTAGFILNSQSENSNAIAFGLSPARLVLLLGVSLAFVGSALALILVVRWSTKTENITQRISALLSVKGYRQFSQLITVLLFLGLCGVLAAGWFLPKIIAVPDSMPIIFARLESTLIFLALLSLEILWLIPQFSAAGPVPDGETENTGRYSLAQLIVITVLILALLIVLGYFFFEWFLILTRAPFAKIAPFFFWQNLENTTPFNLIHLLILSAIGLAGTILVLRFRKYSIITTAVLGMILFTLLYQFYPGEISLIDLRTDNSGSVIYRETVCSFGNFSEIVTNFDSLSDNAWLDTKPPGHLWPFWIVKSLILIISPEKMSTIADCQSTLGTVLSLTTPFFSLLTLIPICLISKRIFPPDAPFTSGIIFLTMPNFLLMATYYTQFFLPLVFSILLLLVIISIEKSSFWWAVLTGSFIYLSVFFSFSLLPGIIMAFLWLGLDFLIRRKLGMNQMIKVGGGYLAGITLFGGLYYLLYHYNPISRFTTSLASHRDQIHTTEWLSKLFENIQISITEYLVWTGPAVLALIILVVLWKKIKQTEYSPSKRVFLIGTGLIFFALLISGQNRAEVGRLWLFLNPLLAISAAIQIDELPKKIFNRTVLVLILIQIWSAYFYLHSLLGVRSY